MWSTLLVLLSNYSLHGFTIIFLWNHWKNVLLSILVRFYIKYFFFYIYILTFKTVLEKLKAISIGFLKLLDKPRREKRKGRKFGRYKIFSTLFLTGEHEIKWEGKLLRSHVGDSFCRKHDVSTIASRVHFSSDDVKKRETRAVYLRVDIAKTRGALCIHISRYRSQDVVRAASNTRESGIARYFRRNHVENGAIVYGK